MRKITTQAVNAFMKQGTYRNDNTRVENSTLYLHDSAIARIDDVGAITITNAGYATMTTKERLNGLPGVHIVQSKGVWYLNGTEWNGDSITI